MSVLLTSLRGEKFQQILPILQALLGLVAGLLAARFVVRLLAVRPEARWWQVLDLLSAPLRAPFAAFDAGQPQFGAVLELSSLAALVLIGALLFLLGGLQSLAHK